MSNNNRIVSRRKQLPALPQQPQMTQPKMPQRRPLSAQEPIQSKKGLKINNQASSVPPPQPDQKTVLDEQVKAHRTKQDEYSERTLDLVPRYRDMIKDKTLLENKSPITRDLEKEVCTKLTNLAREMNTDETQAEGTGNLSICAMLMQIAIIMRDNTNLIDYRVEQLEKKIVSLQNEINVLSQKTKE